MSATTSQGPYWTFADSLNDVIASFADSAGATAADGDGDTTSDPEAVGAVATSGGGGGARKLDLVCAVSEAMEETFERLKATLPTPLAPQPSPNDLPATKNKMLVRRACVLLCSVV